ncbi:MAG: aquaporin [Gemmataceae bacterium]
MRAWIAELIGTFLLIFAGTGAIVINDVSGGAITHVGVALVFGLVVLALIYTFGDVSGSHLNPAVTLGLYLAGRFPPRQVLPYALCQSAGALLASGLLQVLFPDHTGLGATRPAGPALQSFVLEVILTWFLMLTVLRVAFGPPGHLHLIGVIVGAVIALEALFAGPICGASMNPARSLGPAVVSGRVDVLWIYLTAPVLGAALAVPVWRLLRPPEPTEPDRE